MCSRGSSACGSFVIHLVKEVLGPRTKVQVLSSFYYGLKNVIQTCCLSVRRPLLYLISSSVTTVLLLTDEAG